MSGEGYTPELAPGSDEPVTGGYIKAGPISVGDLMHECPGLVPHELVEKIRKRHEDEPTPDIVIVDLNPERANREGDQVLPVAGQQDVFEHVIGMLRARQVVGIKRYGRSLQTFNGRDAGRDLVEELLDAVVYADQDRLERKELARRIDEALEYAAQQYEVRSDINAGNEGHTYENGWMDALVGIATILGVDSTFSNFPAACQEARRTVSPAPSEGK